MDYDVFYFGECVVVLILVSFCLLCVLLLPGCLVLLVCVSVFVWGWFLFNLSCCVVCVFG